MLALMLGLVPGAGATHPDTVEFLGWCIFTVHIVIMFALMCALAYSLLGAFGLLGRNTLGHTAYPTVGGQTSTISALDTDGAQLLSSSRV